MSTPADHESFRRDVRARALAAARTLTLQRGWQQIRFVELADAVGVSRPTLYSEFGNKAGLGQALVLAETTEFLQGLLSELAGHTDDLAGAANAALRFTLLQAHENPLLHGVLTNVGDADLLLLLTTDSRPVLSSAVEVLTAWFAEHFPFYDQGLLAELIEALVRLVLSHLVQPTRDIDATLRSLQRITDLVMTAALTRRP
ncbi:TetR family transcriptional regulator [Jatrophihabitans telluris]|uniref:TetR family transcriptional regulator n=1 Tax=Jatrophihabitans telluris TaxID=2038343 RepID=A0ABY4QXB7_9ACTN|nr:TetR family transcriptional regulator [Jatrophihabitans telluris]UQX88175.1 TetR family transcriptional regulator [Jatrophihabitans telluris]